MQAMRRTDAWKEGSKDLDPTAKKIFILGLFTTEVEDLVKSQIHIETLEEIDSEYREVAKEAFNQQCYVTPCCSSGGGTRTGKR